MKKDIKYILKRIVIGVAIALILANINKCSVFADTKKSLYICGTNFDDICYNDRNTENNEFINLPTLDNYFSYYRGNYYGSSVAFYNYDKEYFHIMQTPYFNQNLYYNYFLFQPFEYDNTFYTYSLYGVASNNLLNSPTDIFITDNPSTADFIYNNTFSQKQGDNEKYEFYKKTLTINKKEIYIIWSQYSIYRNAYIVDLSSPLSNVLYYTHTTTGREVQVQYNGNDGYETFEKQDFVFDLTDYFDNIMDNGGNDWVDNSYTTPTGSGLKKIQGYLSLLKIPIHIYEKMLNQIYTNTCNNLQIPIPFVGSYVNLPCLSSVFENVLSSSAYNFFRSIVNLTYVIIITISNEIFFMKSLTPYLNNINDNEVRGSL